MSKTYSLFRGGQTIDIEKEPEFITAILPQDELLPQVQKYEQVEQVKPVFRNIYKIKTSPGATDEVSDRLRQQFASQGVFHHAYQPVGDGITRYYLTDQIVVAFQPNTSHATIESLLTKAGLIYLRQFPGSPTTLLLRVSSSAGKNPVKLSADLHQDPIVAWAEPNLVNRFLPQATLRPDDPLFAQQWHLESRDDFEMIRQADVDAPTAWATTRGAREVVVALIDDGFDLRHPDLSGTDKIVYPRDFVDGDLRPFPETDQGDYHGTPCAGVAIGNWNGQGIVGIAPDCGFLPIRFPLSADDNLLWDIFDHAGRHADVISCSWGPPPVFDPMSSLLRRKFSSITESGGPTGKGALICFAAGNFNAPLRDDDNRSFTWRHPHYGLLENKRRILNGYCVHEDVVAVAASTSQNRKSLYSNWGKEVNVCAPSDNWNPLDQLLKVPGRGIWTTDNERFGRGFSANSIYTGQFGGTSSATPLVAGIAALLRSANPELSAREIKAILEQSTDKITDDQPDDILGHQKGQYDATGHSEWFGYGKVNAAKALALALPPEPEVENPPASEPEPVVEGLRIAAALVNPSGPESGHETVTLFNQSPRAYPLDGWYLMDKKGRQQKLDGLSIEAGAWLSVPLRARGVQLANSGGSVHLVNPLGLEVHQVTYSRQEARRDGWSLWFQ
ncbi:MAG: S8 family serine peptidase [Bacteroidota bacterium]